MLQRDEIIEMARDAGLLVIGTADGGEAVYTWPAGITEEIETFAKLVADVSAAKEREACAKVCAALMDSPELIGDCHICVDAIRARAQADRGEAT